MYRVGKKTEKSKKENLVKSVHEWKLLRRIFGQRNPIQLRGNKDKGQYFLSKKEKIMSATMILLKCFAYFSLKVSFSCSLHMFITCLSLYTFMGSSINPFMLMNLMRCCSASNSMGGMTASCRICFSVFCHTQDTQRNQHPGVSGLVWWGKLSDNMVLILTCTIWNLMW